jgi:hypothetical protein
VASPPDSQMRLKSSPSNDEVPESPYKEAGDRHDRHADVDVSDDNPVCGDGKGPVGRFHSMSIHLSKLDNLTARGCADKFLKVHTDSWGSSMPRPGYYLHSARASGADHRETRKRRAAVDPVVQLKLVHSVLPRIYLRSAVTSIWIRIWKFSRMLVP